MKSRNILYRILVSGKSVSFSDLWVSKLFFYSNHRLSFVLGVLAMVVAWYESLLKIWIPGYFVDIAPLLLTAAAFVVADKNKLRFGRLHQYGIATLLTMVISGIWAVLSGVAQINALLYIALIMQFYIAFLWAQTQKISQLLDWVTLAFIPATIYGIWQYIYGTSSFHTSYLEASASRVSSLYGSPNIFAFILVVLASVALYRWVLEKRWVYLLASFVFTGVMVLTLSRTAWIAFIVAALYIVMTRVEKLRGILAVGFLPSIGLRMEVIFSGNYWFDSAIDGRLWSLRNGLYIFKKHPLIGTGGGTYGNDFAVKYSSPVYFEAMQHGYVPLSTTDNQYVAMLVQFGLVGFILFALSGLAYWAESYNFSNSYQCLSRVILIMFFIMMLASNALEFTVVALPVGMLLGLFASDDEIQ